MIPRPEGKKDAFFLAWTIHRPSVPAKVIIPLLHSSGRAASPCVEEGERVLAGQKIAEPSDAAGTAVHASISGKVTRIFQIQHPAGGKSAAVEITSDGLDEKISSIRSQPDEDSGLPREKILNQLREMGVVDLGPGMKSVHAKLEKGAKTLVLNASEAEPYLASDYVLLMSHPLEILKGAEILRKAAGAENIVIVTENPQREGAELLKSKIYFLKWQHAEVLMLPSAYPAHEPLLLKKIGIESGAVLDLATAYAAYEAVCLHKPVFERVVTVAGECVMEPRNLWARIGAEFGALTKACKGFMREPRKLVAGGPLSGRAHSKLETPLLKETRAVIALPLEAAKPEDPEPCTRCGLCIEACPAGISPVMITLAAENDMFKIAEAYGASLCIESGNCSYVCPAKRPMMELMRYAASHVS